jgi:muconolactone delta-isomerase
VATPLSPHPDDPGWQAREPGPSAPAGGSEFLTTFTVTVPDGTPAAAVANTEAREADRARELAAQGHLLRLWRLPGSGRSLGLWQADSTSGMQAILASLPLRAWMSVETMPLTTHPSDPALASH